MAGERLAGSVLSSYLSKLGNQAVSSVGPAVGGFVKNAATNAATNAVMQAAGHVDAPGLLGSAAQVMSGLNPAKVGSAAGTAANIGSSLVTAAAADALKNAMLPTTAPVYPTPRQRAGYNQMMQASMYPPGAYAVPQNIPVNASNQQSEKATTQVYYNPNEAVTAAAKMYAAMPKMQF
jgi:hypothetical protein